MNYRVSTGALLGLPVMLGMALTPSVGYAEDESSGLEEIIVTATRVESSIQDTAIAVSAFTGDIMDDMNLGSAMDYEALVPSLSIQLSPNRTSIRGVGRFSNQLGIAPGVAMYNDGAYLQENTALGSNALNTDRVEILRGPQGTLFGRNTTGGATNVIKRKPKDEFEMDLLLATGNYGRNNVELFVGGPVTDTVRAKLYYNRWEHDGVYKNKGGPDTNGTTEDPNYYAEVIIDWKPTERLFLMWKVEHLQYSNLVGGTSYFTPYDSFNVCTSPLGWCNTGYDQVQAGVDEPMDPRTVDVNRVGEMDLDAHVSHNFHLKYDFDNVQMTYIGHHNRYDWDYLGVDYDSTSNLENGAINDCEQDQRFTSHEITFASTGDSALQWVTGAYYMDDENHQPWSLRDQGTNPGHANIMSARMWEGGGGAAPLSTADIIGQNPELIYYKYDAWFWNDNWSVFGEFTYHFSDSWALTLGARYSVDNLKASEQQWQYGDSKVYINPDWWAGWCPWVPVFTPGEECITRGAMDYSPSAVPRVSTETFKDTSGRMIVEYTPNDDSLYWFTISNAFKVGGIIAGSMEGIDNGDDPFFDGEEITMYELGWKGTVGDNLQLELIAFSNDYKDMQQIRTWTNDVGVSNNAVVNIDTAMYGVEAQAQWLATDSLMVMFTYSYNHAEFDEHLLLREQTLENRCDEINEFGDCMIDVYGNQLDITPEQKFAVHALYTVNTGVGEIALGGTWSHVGERHMDVFNRPETKGDAYRRLDLTATWTSVSGNWQVRGWVKNATDELWYNTRGAGANSNPAVGGAFPETKYVRYSGNPADPRYYSLEVRYRL